MNAMTPPDDSRPTTPSERGAASHGLEPSLLLGPAKDPAIIVDHISKKFRIYDERNRSLKAAVMRGRRARFQEFQAVDDVSFEVERGTTFGLVGENGCGKSTTLKCITRTIRPETGTITVDGRMSALLELGAGFHPELSGRENVYLNASILGMRKREVDAKLDEIVEFAGLERFIDMPVKNYSSGMYVRLGFAVAINVNPDILLVDEVLAVGDEEFQRKCNEKFATFRDAGGTIVVVSHGLEVMRDICDHAVWLEHGRITASGTSGDVIDHYLDMVRSERIERARERIGDGAGASPNAATGTNIVRAEMLHADTRDPVESLTATEGFVLRVTFDAEAVGEDVRTNFGIYRDDGQRVGSFNSGWSAADGPLTTVEMVAPRCPLQPGTYAVNVAIHDHSMLQEFERIDKFARFEVLPSEDRHQSGMVDFSQIWRTA
ncbi:MAG: ABC transporter ATP-binding protein [Microthrixaceae bacterium]|nr:ABC transporter ATP-binding protein [Actinomycetota bacterium]MBP6728237.1 ABC transporter ATP-binding protein [Microthrixaceae bacterium]